jgi:hypothetical protein
MSRMVADEREAELREELRLVEEELAELLTRWMTSATSLAMSLPAQATGWTRPP